MNLTKTRTVQVVGAFVLLVLVALLWLFLLSPRMSQPGDLHGQADSMNSNNAQLQSAIKALKNKQQNLPAERQYADALAARVPASADQQELFDEIRQAAAKAGIPDSSITSVVPSVPQTGNIASGGATLPGQGTASGIGSMQLNLTVNAPIDRLVVFIKQLENMPRAYLINTVNLAPDDPTKANGTYSLTVNGSMFVLPAPTDPTTKGGASASASAPVSSATVPATK